MLRWMGGEVAEVVSHVRTIDATYDNAFNAMVKFESGATGFLVANWMVGARVLHGREFSRTMISPWIMC